MPRRPAVFIPGYPGSGLHDTIRHRDIFPPEAGDLLGPDRGYIISRLQAPENPDIKDGVVTNSVIRDVRVLGWEVSKEAGSLYHNLVRLGYTLGEDVRPIPWDWRLPVYSRPVTNRVRAGVLELAAAYGMPVVVIAHSTGGLVLRALLEQSPPAVAHELVRSIDHILTLGVPWVGTLKTLRYVGRGEREAIISGDEMRSIIGRSWAGFDLMPPDPERTEMTDERGRPLDLFLDHEGRQTSPLTDRRWMRGQPHLLRRAEASDRTLGARSRTFTVASGDSCPPITNIVGWGAETETTYQLDPAGFRMRSIVTEEGDLTVPRRSAAWLRGPGVRTFTIPVGLYEGFLPQYHSQIWDTEPVKEVMQHVLTGTPLANVVTAAVDNEDVLEGRSGVRVRVVAQDVAGRPLPEARAYFGPQAGQGGRRYPIPGVALTLLYRKGFRPPSGPYLCPVTVEWTEAGARQSRTFPRYFWPR